VTLANGPLANTVRVRTGAERQVLQLRPQEARQISLALGGGFPYQGRWVWEASLASERGFVPMFEEGGADNRFLGVFVKPELKP
jgi:hypothetical protein